jgi:hypothetical protein
VPLKKKEVKWKNQNGSGCRRETRLNTREFTGGKKKLRKLQDDYFKYLRERYNVRKNTSDFGIPIYRGIKAEEQKKSYSKHTNHELAVLRAELKQIEDNIERKEKELEIARKEAQMKRKELVYDDEIKSHKKKARSNWMNRGVKDNPEIFHDDTRKKGSKLR